MSARPRVVANGGHGVFDERASGDAMVSSIGAHPDAVTAPVMTCVPGACLNPAAKAGLAPAARLLMMTEDDAVTQVPGAYFQGRSSVSIVVELVGSGGMGDVWLADQTYSCRRQVALKIIKAGMEYGVCDRAVRSRAAGARDHGLTGNRPVLDAGAMPLGLLFFVMEHAREPFTVHCRSSRVIPRRTTGSVPRRSRWRAARASEGHHRSRPQALECAATFRMNHQDPKIIDFGVARYARSR